MASQTHVAIAAAEAENLGRKQIGTEHLLLGVLREERSLAAQTLNECGVRLSFVREQLSSNIK
jgi:ATP-dependent Clp protease ATP-binding subunit ClpC